jgi:tetratricopeptide (TPR) repeat protein
MAVSSADIAEVEALYDRGLMLQAYERGKRHGALRDWTGPDAECMAARLATHLGAPRTSSVILLEAQKKYPQHPRVALHNAYSLLGIRGMLETWEFIEGFGPPRSDDRILQADWLALRAYIAALFRDFYRAENFLAEAETLAPDHPWIGVERSSLLHRQDRYAESLETARRVLELRPWYRSGVQVYAHALRLLDRHEEALEFLTEADGHLECCWVTSQLASLQLHLEEDQQALSSLKRFVELTPLMDKNSARWLAAIRSRLAYRLGDYQPAAEQAELAGGKYFRAVAENLRASDGQGQRKVLAVRFVRQHHVTCAPATLTVIAKFWDMPVEHLGLAEQICYDGTSAYSQRKWAEDNGWVAREFDITWDATVQLIDRGLPFTLTLTAPDNAHLQAVVGYDARKRTLVVRDPYVPDLSEPLADKMLQDLKSMGPRGMVLVPKEHAERLDGLELPAAEIYDTLNQVAGALESYDWRKAWAVYEQMAAENPDHHLTIMARRAVAGYDADNTALLECAEKLGALHPDCEITKVWRLSCLQELGRRDERLELLERECNRRDSDPGFWWRYADDLRVDARHHQLALKFARKAVRASGGNDRTYHILADLLWNMGEYDRALEQFRFATCLDDMDEHNAMAYFRAARRVKRTEEALDLLRARFVRFGRKSSGPAITLGQAMEELDRTPEAILALERGLSLRPEEGYLLLNICDLHARSGNGAEAARYLELARDKVSRAAWLHNAAAVAKYAGDSQKAIGFWHQLLRIQPLNVDAHRAVAELFSEMVGEERALAHIEEYARRFPSSYAIHQLWVEWIRETDAEAYERTVRLLLEINPADGWGLRELCLALQKQQRHEEALAVAEEACQADPVNPYCHLFRGSSMEALNRLGEAREDYRAAIRLDVDCGPAVQALLSSSASLEQTRADLALVHAELVRQTIYGDGLLAYYNYATGILPPRQLLASITEAWKARPDLWHAWSALIWQLMDMSKLDEALERIDEACARFPFVPQLWLDRAKVCRARMEADEEIASLQRAAEINPGWGRVCTALATALSHAGRLEDARKVMESAVSHNALDPGNHGELAEVLWELGEEDAAIEEARKAIRLAPGLGRAWSNLQTWSEELGTPEIVVELARQLSARRPGDPECWLNLARVLRSDDDREESDAAISRALELDPRSIDAHDLRATTLSTAGDFDAALEACAPAEFPEGSPLRLRATAAWVEAQRGNLARATGMMNQIVEERPDYLWAWQQLADWYQTTGSRDGFERAAERLAELDPHNPVPLVYHSEARLAVGDRAGAKADLARALALSPDYAYAGLSLFDLHAEDNELVEAEQVLETLKRTTADEFVTLRSIDLRIKQDRLPDALQEFQAMCSEESTDHNALRGACGTIEEAAGKDKLRDALREALRGKSPCAEVAAILAEGICARLDFDECRKLLGELHSRPELWQHAASTYVEALGRNARLGDLDAFLQEHREALRADDDCWGSVAYALCIQDLATRTVQWMEDWQQRKPIKGWMLSNLSTALRQLGRTLEARRIELLAITLPRDNCTDAFMIWLACDDALAGRTAEAAERMSQVNTEELNPYNQFLKAFIDGVIEMQVADAARRKAIFKRLKRVLRRTLKRNRHFLSDKAARQAVEDCIESIAKARGGLLARWWKFRTKLGWPG